jgi:hypothetical protein
VHKRVTGTLEEIKKQLKELQKDPKVDLIQVFAVMIHQEQQRYADALTTIDQYSEMLSRQSATNLEQNTTILELRAEIARRRAKNPTPVEERHEDAM